MPENQAGFRAKRGCAHQIFTLSSLIQIQFSKFKGKLVAFFIDFKKSFPSINHSLLWVKLAGAGVSSKIIRKIKSLYDSARMSIKTQFRLTSPVEVSEGVMQGETLSPFLFTIFINDLETYLRDHGIDGISVNHLTDILLLAYADDIVLLADSRGGSSTGNKCNKRILLSQ